MSGDRQEILLATGAEQLAKQLIRAMADTGINVVAASDGVEAIYIAEKSKPAILVLDEEITKIPAPDIAMLVRKFPGLERLRIIYLHASDISNMNGTADLYIKKPLDVRDLITIITGYLSEKDPVLSPSSAMKKVVGHLVVDRETYLVSYKGAKMLLPRKEFELVFLLASNPNKVFTREEIFAKIWDREFSIKAGRTIDVHIRKLRSKLDDTLIITVKGIGYKLG
jgi:two-component system alkaline phosphatase synthesis response regulator PhoP